MASYMSVFKYLEIQLEDIKSATNNFHDSRVIGSGGFGNVYRGELSRPEGKIEVAFKRLDRKHGQGDPEFFKEIRMLSSYKHDNLISLLGYCNEGNEMILMYEYAARGSLERILNDAALTWTQRLKICIDAAKGLSFLHDANGTQQRVLHRDIKSANILLDESLNAKLADFGLSKISPANQSYTFLVTNPVGTPGYCDPLYMDTYQLTKESDVYSFGVVLFEVLCGRVCYEHRDGNFRVFVHFWKRCYEQRKLDEIIFPDLKHQLDPSSVETFVDIAYQCLQKTREQRPTMSVVVDKLRAALELKGLHDLKLQREHELEQMCKAAELLKFADPPLIYNKTVKDVKALLSEGFPVNGGKTWFSLNEKEEHCEMLSIQHCLISREGGYSFHYTHLYSSFPRVYRTDKKGFKVHIRTQFLTPLIDYTVKIVLCNGSPMYKQKYVALRYKLEGETETSIAYLANKTKDNRSFIAELYQFTSNGGTFELDIVFEDHIENLEVEGILLQPLEKVEYDQTLENEELSFDSLQWTMKKDLLSDLLKRFHIYNDRMGSAVDKNGKKSLMFSARSVITNCGSFQILSESRFESLDVHPRIGYSFAKTTDVIDLVSIKRHTRIIFGEVAVLISHYFYIEKEIESDLLSPETTYACYLVYKLPQDQSKFEGLMRITNNYIWDLDPDYPYIYLVTPPETPIIGQKLDQNTHNPLNRAKLNPIPRQRKDGWMEVKVSHFQTPSSTQTIHMGLWLRTPDRVVISGLIIESIELRPYTGAFSLARILGAGEL